jgi:hypothetical protein
VLRRGGAAVVVRPVGGVIDPSPEALASTRLRAVRRTTRLDVAALRSSLGVRALGRAAGAAQLGRTASQLGRATRRGPGG